MYDCDDMLTYGCANRAIRRIDIPEMVIGSLRLTC